MSIYIKVSKRNDNTLASTDFKGLQVLLSSTAVPCSGLESLVLTALVEHELK